MSKENLEKSNLTQTHIVDEWLVKDGQELVRCVFDSKKTDIGTVWIGDSGDGGLSVTIEKETAKMEYNWDESPGSWGIPQYNIKIGMSHFGGGTTFKMYIHNRQDLMELMSALKIIEDDMDRESNKAEEGK